jgi:phospholipid transport system substrate-binding protein
MSFFSRSIRRAALVLTLVMLSIGSPRAAGESASVATIERLNTTLMSVMQNAARLGYDGRYRELEPIVRRSFDHPLMAQIMTGRFWATFNAAQREHLTATMRRFTAATYAARFDGYSGQRFEILSEAVGPRDTVLVKTRIASTAAEPVAIDYLMHPAESGSEIIDVFFNQSISEVALRRSEYTAVLGRDGFDGLIASIENKIRDLERQSVASSK